jgi:hypothetical protein
MRQNAGLFTQHVSSIIMPIFRSALVSTAFWYPNLWAVWIVTQLSRVTSCVQHTQLTALRYTTQTAYRFGHQKAVLTIVLLMMGILMLETC